MSSKIKFIPIRNSTPSSRVVKIYLCIRSPTCLNGRRGRERGTPREDCQILASMSAEHISLLSSFKPAIRRWRIKFSYRNRLPRTDLPSFNRSLALCFLISDFDCLLSSSTLSLQIPILSRIQCIRPQWNSSTEPWLCDSIPHISSAWAGSAGASSSCRLQQLHPRHWTTSNYVGTPNYRRRRVLVHWIVESRVDYCFIFVYRP